MSYERRAKLISIFLTVTISAAVVMLLLYLYLSPSLEIQQTEEKIDTSELLLEGEYVKYGDYYQPDVDENQPDIETNVQEETTPDELTDAGEAAPDPAQLMASKEESPVKVKEEPKPKKTGPTKEELEKQEREKQQKESAEKISKRVKFGSTSTEKAQGKGKSGSPNGNAATGTVYGLPGASLAGRTLAKWSYPKSPVIGSITIRIKVNRTGEVISADYFRGSGPVASVQDARESCVQAAKKSTFSPDDSAPVEQLGTITYTFE